MIANKIASWRRQREEDDALEHTLSVLRLRLKDMSQVPENTAITAGSESTATPSHY